MVILLNALSIFHQNLLNAKSIFTHQSIKATISPKRRDMPSACFQCADTLSIASKYTTKKYQRRIFKAVGNGALWLTPCKLACERSLVIGQYQVSSVGEGRSWKCPLVKTITDPLRGSTPCVHCYHQAARPCDCVGKTTCMVFRIMRHLRCLPRLYQFPPWFFHRTVMNPIQRHSGGGDFWRGGGGKKNLILQFGEVNHSRCRMRFILGVYRAIYVAYSRYDF